MKYIGLSTSSFSIISQFHIFNLNFDLSNTNLFHLTNLYHRYSALPCQISFTTYNSNKYYTNPTSVAFVLLFPIDSSPLLFLTLLCCFLSSGKFNSRLWLFWRLRFLLISEYMASRYTSVNLSFFF